MECRGCGYLAKRSDAQGPSQAVVGQEKLRRLVDVLHVLGAPAHRLRHGCS